MIKKIIIFIVNSLILWGAFLCLTFIKIDSMNNIIKLLFLIIINILYLTSIIFKWLKYYKISRFFYVLFITISIGLFGYIILYKLEIIDTISSITKLKNYILSTKEKGVFIYILLQMAQVIILPVPAAIICIVGSLIYGPLLGSIYCSIGILLGSFVSFWIGKTFGNKIVTWIAGVENTEKYSKIIRKRGAFFLIIAFLLPMFPDDILCLISGISNMKFKNFALITTITRPIGVICMSYFGGGHIIPFNGWGLYVWIILLIAFVFLVILMYKYQERMQNYILNKIIKNKNKRNNTES